MRHVRPLATVTGWSIGIYFYNLDMSKTQPLRPHAEAQRHGGRKGFCFFDSLRVLRIFAALRELFMRIPCIFSD
jgi:hypothetical protein